MWRFLQCILSGLVEFCSFRLKLMSFEQNVLHEIQISWSQVFSFVYIVVCQGSGVSIKNHHPCTARPPVPFSSLKGGLFLCWSARLSYWTRQVITLNLSATSLVKILRQGGPGTPQYIPVGVAYCLFPHQGYCNGLLQTYYDTLDKNPFMSGSAFTEALERGLLKWWNIKRILSTVIQGSLFSIGCFFIS